MLSPPLALKIECVCTVCASVVIVLLWNFLMISEKCCTSQEKGQEGVAEGDQGTRDAGWVRRAREAGGSINRRTHPFTA